MLVRPRPAVFAAAAALIASLCVMVSGASASVDYSATVQGDGPIAYWRLGEAAGAATAADATGNGNTGTYSTSVALGAPGAVVDDPDTAARFDGTSGKIAVADSAALRLNGPFTIELWAKMTSFANSWPGLLVKGSAGTASGYLIWYSSDGTAHFKRNNYDFTSKPGALTTAGFSHLVFTYDGTTAA